MRHVQAGERVYALSHGRSGVLYLFGFGTYVGDEVPESAVGHVAEGVKLLGRANPKIVLDSGDVVWGCECWWGAESEWPDISKGRTIVNLDVKQERQKALKEQS